MLLAEMTRLAEGAVGNDLLSGRTAAAAAKWGKKEEKKKQHTHLEVVR